MKNKICKKWKPGVEPEDGHERQEEDRAGAVDQREEEDEREEGRAVRRAADVRGLAPERGQQCRGQGADQEEAVDDHALVDPSGGHPPQEGVGDGPEVGDLDDD